MSEFKVGDRVQVKQELRQGILANPMLKRGSAQLVSNDWQGVICEIHTGLYRFDAGVTIGWFKPETLEPAVDSKGFVVILNHDGDGQPYYTVEGTAPADQPAADKEHGDGDE